MSLFHRQTKPAISIFTTSEGHYSLAQAAQQAFGQKYTVHFNLVQGKEFTLYTPFYLFFPQLFKFPSNLALLQP